MARVWLGVGILAVWLCAIVEATGNAPYFRIPSPESDDLSVYTYEYALKKSLAHAPKVENFDVEDHHQLLNSTVHSEFAVQSAQPVNVSYDHRALLINGAPQLLVSGLN